MLYPTSPLERVTALMPPPVPPAAPVVLAFVESRPRPRGQTVPLSYAMPDDALGAEFNYCMPDAEVPIEASPELVRFHIGTFKPRMIVPERRRSLLRRCWETFLMWFK